MAYLPATAGILAAAGLTALVYLHAGSGGSEVGVVLMAVLILVLSIGVTLSSATQRK
jgi:phosphate starvation-inducible membrane PsiE